MRGFTIAGSLLAVPAASLVGGSVARADDVLGGVPSGQTIDEDKAPAPLIRPRSVLHPVTLPAGSVPPVVNSSTIFLNRCASGCTVRSGSTDSRTDTADIANSSSQLAAFKWGDTTWNGVVSCMKQVYANFGVTITDVDPGTAAHFEIMIAGTSDQMDLSADIGGIADYPCSGPGNCQSYEPNALVFDFANESFYDNNVNEICATAAQEIAHAFTLDHVVDDTDPMTYNEGFSGIRYYHNSEKCGSDCVSGKSPFGLTCSGSGGTATHTCYGTGSATQNELDTITALFGSGTSTPPTVKIESPANGATVQPGFVVEVSASDDVGVQSVELEIDGTMIKTLTSMPFAFNAPTTLGQGTHHLQAIATDVQGTTATDTIDVVLGTGCSGSNACASGQVCLNGACIAGSGTPGGLGATCNGNGDCQSDLCGDDGAGHKYCVTNCDTTNSDCPGGYGCLATGSGSAGVCWPGADSGGTGGGCDTTSGGSGSTAPITLGLVLAALAFTRKRR